MTGLNRALIEDEKMFLKSATRLVSYDQQSLIIPPFTLGTTSFPVNSSTFLYDTANYYQANTLYFLNSTDNINLDLDFYDFDESTDTENAMSIKTKKTFRIVVKGLGIPANFNANIVINPNPENPDEAGFIYKVKRTTLGISEWVRDNSQPSNSDKNKAMFSEAQKAWLGRLHGDIIDMAFYYET